MNALKKKEGCELRRGAVYTRYKEWCGENGYRAEAAKNLNQEIEKRYKTARKRPNDGASSSTTPMVLDVAFTASEESKRGLCTIDIMSLKFKVRTDLLRLLLEEHSEIYCF